MQEWTKEQREAILARNSNLLVAAAAGSGKTAVLVERIIQLVLRDKVDIDRMLIVTFTHAAAGEMRERISSSLLAEMEKNDENEDYFRSQLNLLNRASISTLHAFCKDVVKRYFHLLDIDPNFRIGDTTETSIMKLETVEELLENEYQKGAASFLELVEIFGGIKDDTPLQDLILRTYEFIQSKPEPLRWLEERVEDFKINEAEFLDCPWMQSLMRQLKIDLSGVKDLLKAALDITELPNGPDSYRTALLEDQKIIERLIMALEEGIYEFYQQISGVQYARLARVGPTTDPDLQEEVKVLREQGKKVINTIRSEILFQSPEEFRQDLNELYPALGCLDELVKAFAIAYQAKKTDKGIVDFNDLEHYALTILADSKVAQEYRSKYLYIFVDEYQDSNLVQETILNYIKRKDNLFLVGDVKQSIYRFRLADPSLFMDKYRAFSSGKEMIDRRIDLSMNFRSRSEIIHGVNGIFARIMSHDFGEIDYDEKVYLYPGLVGPADNGGEPAPPALELILIDKNSEVLQLTEDMGEEEEQAGDTELEAQIVAQRIKQLWGTPFYDSKQGCYRSLEYQDIVVLMRATRQQSDVFADTLMTAGIPVYADVDGGYFRTLEINIFINLLKVIDNKRQDIPLISVLRSPIGKFTIDDLIAIRVNSPAFSYYEAVQEYIENKNDELQVKLREFIAKLNHWKEEARFTDMDEFIWGLMLETGYYHYVSAMPGGQQRQANLRILLERAGQFQSTSMKGLFSFIKFVDKIQAGRGDMGMAKMLGENDNVVRIMSIHKSKGLEFPVVIISGMGRGFNSSDTRASVLFHKDLGLGPYYVNPKLRVSRNTIARMVMKNRIKMENLAEEMRILYVACTRPREKLIMVGSVRDLPLRTRNWNKAISPFQLARGVCPLDWVGPVVMRHRDGFEIRKLSGLVLEDKELPEDKSHWQVDIISRSNISKEDQQKQEARSFQELWQEYSRLGGSPERDKIWSRLDWHYPYAEAVELPSKLSVSQIKNLQSWDLKNLGLNKPHLETRPRFITAPSAEQGSFSFTGAAKGTIMHMVMQHLDIHRVSSEEAISGQIQDMVQSELLREEEAGVVDVIKILNFFGSDLGQRIIQAAKVYREVPFNLVCKAAAIFKDLEECEEELLIQGVIDLYFRENKGLVLVDYKTDRITAENREEIIEKYRVQVQLYQTALETIQNQRVKDSYLYLFDCDEAVKL